MRNVLGLTGLALLLGCDPTSSLPDAGNIDAPDGASPRQDAGPSGPPIALSIRVEGLTLGEELTLSHGGATLTAQLNDPYAFEPRVPAGAPLDLRVVTQPTGQTCSVSELAPATVPADGAPVFVRCVHLPAAPLTEPTTAPDEPLSIGIAPRESAYPGIPYESRLAVHGGIYPYAIQLTSMTLDGVAQSTADVVVDYRRGTVRFTPASEGVYAFTLEIRDSRAEQQMLVHTFSVRASRAAFVFLATDGSDATGDGSEASPYATLGHALAQSTPDQALILRRGVHATGGFTLDDDHAQELLAYPDEVVVLDLARSGIGIHNNTAPAARIEGIDIAHVLQYGIVSDPSPEGVVIRGVRFLDGEEWPEGPNSENPGFIHGWGGGPNRFLIQECDFGRYVMHSAGAHALTLFDTSETIVENNQIRLGDEVSGGINDKDSSFHNTYRENYIAFGTASTLVGILVMGQDDAERVHIHHNLLIHAGVTIGVQCFQETCYMRDMHVDHNTLISGGMGVNWGPFNPTSDRTSFEYNVIVSETRAPYGGLSCQSGIPSGFTRQLTASANLIVSSSALAFDDWECSGNDLSWDVWRDTYGMDATGTGSTGIGSTVLSTLPLAGSGPTTGLPAEDPRRAVFGHRAR